MNTKRNTSRKDVKRDFQKLVSKLENMILTGIFKPRERLVEAALSQMFNVSRYWIRDALKILETKGVVTVIPYKGAVVSELSEQEVEEIFIIRVSLEQLAARLAGQNATGTDIQTLRRMAKKVEEGLGQNDLEDMIAADTNFHDCVFQLSRNQTLRRMITDLRNRCRIIRYSAWSSTGVLQEIIREHNLLIEALERKDIPSLVDLAERHISHAKQFYLSQIRTEAALKA